MGNPKTSDDPKTLRAIQKAADWAFCNAMAAAICAGKEMPKKPVREPDLNHPPKRVEVKADVAGPSSAGWMIGEE